MLQQSKILSASQVKNSFGAIVNQLRTGEFSEVIVENHGRPLVAILPIGDLARMREFRQQSKQKEALALLRKSRKAVQTRLKGKISELEAEGIADRFGREFAQDLRKEGKVKFERKSS